MEILKSKRFVVRKSLIGKNQIIEVTFKNGKIDQFLNKLPLTSIVLETDAPYLSPKPFRGKRNETAYLPLILDKIAECYSQSREDIAAVTTQNAKALFKIEGFEIKK